MSITLAPIDLTKTMLAGLCYVALEIDPALTGVTGAIDGTFTKAAHGLLQNQPVRLVSGTAIDPLTANTTYYVIHVSDTAFKLSAKPEGVALTLTAAASAIVMQPVLGFEAAKLSDDSKESTKDFKWPDKKGVQRTRRSTTTESDDVWTFGVPEVKRLPSIFEGKLKGRRTGVATLWLSDVDDEDTVVSLKSQDRFAVTISRDGKLDFGGDFSSATIKIVSNENDGISFAVDETV